MNYNENNRDNLGDTATFNKVNGVVDLNSFSDAS